MVEKKDDQKIELLGTTVKKIPLPAFTNLSRWASTAPTFGGIGSSSFRWRGIPSSPWGFHRDVWFFQVDFPNGIGIP